jgi:pyoverdine/dityrosine biosynthesis protein Dit1
LGLGKSKLKFIALQKKIPANNRAHSMGPPVEAQSSPFDPSEAIVNLLRTVQRKVSVDAKCDESGTLTLHELLCLRRPCTQPGISSNLLAVQAWADIVKSLDSLSTIFSVHVHHSVCQGKNFVVHADVQPLLCERLVHRFEALLKRTKLDQWNQEGRVKFSTRVRQCISLSQPIPFCLPAFPFKSTNTASKVIGAGVDMAEVIALNTLAQFVRDVQSVYSPGIEFVILFDGRMFNDLLLVDDEIVSMYCRTLQSLCPLDNYGRPALKFVSLDEIFTSAKSYSGRRLLIEALYGLDPATAEANIATSEKIGQSYRGLCRFMTQELDTHRQKFSFSNSRFKAYVKQISRRMMARSYAFNCLIADLLLPRYIRLSIHPHDNVNKIGVNLVSRSGDNDWGTPWHNVATLRSNGTWELMRRSQAEDLGLTLTQDSNGYAYFVEDTTA